MFQLTTNQDHVVYALLNTSTSVTYALTTSPLHTLGQSITAHMDATSPSMVMVLGTCATAEQALSLAQAWCLNNNRQDLLNQLAAPHKSNRGMRVKCIETGVVYDSAAQASDAHGVFPSAMSNHLNRPTRFKRVAGKTFVRVPA